MMSDKENPSTTNDWWGELTQHEQEAYLKEHPGSKLEPTQHKAVKDGEKEVVKEKPAAPGEKWLRKGMTIADADRGNLPEHIKAMKLPPGWGHLQFNPDPDANLVAIGLDAKGRDQYVYSESFIALNQAMKFARIREIDKKFTSMLNQTIKNQDTDDRRQAEHALVAELIFRTGIRPGSNEDTGAEKKAYGATTLETRHVFVNDKGDVRLRFVGKKGVDIDLPINDERLKKLLVERTLTKKSDEKLFSGVSDESIRDYVKTLDGGDFKTKDIRTALGTRLARTVMKKTEPPKNEKEYKIRVMEIGKAVSKVLANKPAVALSAYIDPTLFQGWKQSAGIGV